MSIVVALSGWRQSGKDASSLYLTKEKGFTRLAFADILKDLVAKTYKIPRNWCDDSKFKEVALNQYPVTDNPDAFSEQLHRILFKEFKTGMNDNNYPDYDTWINTKDRAPLYFTARSLCIMEGSIKRTCDPNFWVNAVVEEIKANPHRKYIITDLRYRSEVRKLKLSLGAAITVVRLERFNDITSTDASERDLDNFLFDHIIENKGSLQDLYVKLDKLVESIE